MLGAILGAAAKFFGASQQASAAKSAARSQERAAERQLELARETRDLSRADLAPYREAGIPQQNLLNYYLGISREKPVSGGALPEIERIGGSSGGDSFVRMGGAATVQEARDADKQPGYRVNGRTFNNYDDALAFAESNRTGGEEMLGFARGQEKFWRTPEEMRAAFRESPGYGFRRDEGLSAVEASAAARGGLYSGAAMQALQERADGLASQEWNRWLAREDRERENYLTRLEGGIARGQNAASGSATINMNTAQMGANALANIGDAQASGAIGAANAWSSGIENALGSFQYMNTLNRMYPQGGGASSTPATGTTGGGFNIRPFMNPFR